MGVLVRAGQKIEALLDAAGPLDTFHVVFTLPSELASLLFFVPTVLPVDRVHLPYYRIHTVGLGGREERARAFEYALNDATQSVLSWRGTPENGDAS